MSELQSLSEDFLLALDLERNYSPQTQRTYRYALTQFLGWLDEQQMAQDLENLTAGTVREFLAYLRDQRRNDPKSIQLKLAALKSFVAYLRDRLPSTRRSGLPSLNWRYKSGQKTPRVLRDDELDALLAVAYRERERLQTDLVQATGNTARLRKQVVNAARNLLILLLLAGTGLRVSELCSLDVSDVDLPNRTIRVTGKGRKQRVVYFDTPELVQTMELYLEIRSTGPASGALFPNARDGGRLTTRSVQLLLQRYRQLAGLDDRVTPHTLRHSFATLSIERGANIKAVSQLLGHSHVSTTLQMCPWPR